MTYPMTPAQFLAGPSTDEDDYDEPARPSDPLILMALSLESIATSLARPIAARDAEAADAHAAELLELGQAYDDLEDKHRALYELLADVEKIVAPSTSKLANAVREAINAWRNPVVDAEPASGETSAPEPQPVVEGGTQPPAADASIEAWRAYGEARGVEGAASMNRSQIRTALGLSHFDAAGE